MSAPAVEKARRLFSVSLMLAGVLGCTSKAREAQPSPPKQAPPAQRGEVNARAGNQPRQLSLIVAGYGIEAIPRLPVGVASLEDGTLIFGPVDAAAAQAQANGAGIKNVLIKPGRAPGGAVDKRPFPGTELVTLWSGEKGTTMLVLGAGMADYEPVLEAFRTADRPAAWSIVTDDHEIRWPMGFTLRVGSDVKAGSWPYELGLDGSTENLLFLQGPLTGAQIPPPEYFAAPGMQQVGQGVLKGTVASVRWIELAYQEDGAAWRQRSYYLPVDSESVYLLRVQGKTDVTGKMFEAADLVATSFTPRR